MRPIIKLAINAMPLLSPLTGIGRYTYEISKRIHASRDEVDCEFYYGYYSSKLIEPDANIKDRYGKIKGIIKKVPVVNRMARSVRDSLGTLSRRNFDVYFEPKLHTDKYSFQKKSSDCPGLFFFKY